MLVKVFEAKKSLVKWYYAAAYGIYSWEYFLLIHSILQRFWLRSSSKEQVAMIW